LRDFHSHTATITASAATEQSVIMMTIEDIQNPDPDRKHPDTAKLLMFICYY
jgi:hypothetical protein